MRVSDHVHALRLPFTLPMPDGRSFERFVYAYVLVEGGVLLVDGGVRGYANDLVAYLGEIGLAASSVAWTVLTHAHPDHVGGLAGVVAATGCRTAAHADAAAWATDTERQFRERPVPGFHEIVEGPVRLDRLIGPDAVVGGDGVPAVATLETPGHAPGHVALFYETDGVLLSGDALPQPGAMPIYDDVRASVASIERLRALGSRTELLLSSWDEPCRGADVAARLEAALDQVQRVHDAVRAGLAVAGPQLPRLLPVVVERLRLPPFASNPLTARTIAAHLVLASEPRVLSC